jgi:hypothetical protein
MIAYDRLSQIVPQDQALAAKALATGLQQITGITNLTLPVLAEAVANLQTTVNLPLISALTQAVTVTAADYLSNIAGTAGSPVVVCDALGIAAGYKVTDNFVNTTLTLANTDTAYLTTVYETMNNVVIDTYGNAIAGPVIIPPGLPAAGTYYANTGTAADSAMTGDPASIGPGLIPVAQTEIGTILYSSPNQVSDLNSYFESMAAQVTLEQTIQAAAQIDFANLEGNNISSVCSLVGSLPTYGVEVEAGGQAQFWEGVANIATFTGQAVVAVLREGVNLAALGAAGIQTNTLVPSAPNPPLAQANLIPATYTADQAANSVVK